MKPGFDTRLTKSYYKISEAAEIIGVPQSTLRFWESEFKELSPRRSAHNQRYYTPDDLELLQIINFLIKIKGLKIEAAKEQIKHNRKNISKRLEVVDKLKEVREDLSLLLQSLNLRGQKLGLFNDENTESQS